MHSYQHNIKTFNNATRHLTHVERALYRDLIELYYDTEQPLPGNDLDALCRRVLARTEDEKAAVKSILGEFFVLTGDVYTHDYCDSVIEYYKRVHTSKALAGKASAEIRRNKSAARKRQREQEANRLSTDGEQALNGCSTGVCNQKPETINHKPETNLKETNSRRFTPPEREEVQEYITEKNYKHVTADGFVNFYGSKNWMVGKNKMTNWKQAVSGWEARKRTESPVTAAREWFGE